MIYYEYIEFGCFDRTRSKRNDIKAITKQSRIIPAIKSEDEREGESLSIENQKLILEKYVTERGWKLIDEYIDDGYSGTNF